MFYRIFTPVNRISSQTLADKLKNGGLELLGVSSAYNAPVRNTHLVNSVIFELYFKDEIITQSPKEVVKRLGLTPLGEILAKNETGELFLTPIGAKDFRNVEDVYLEFRRSYRPVNVYRGLFPVINEEPSLKEKTEDAVMITGYGKPELFDIIPQVLSNLEFSMSMEKQDLQVLQQPI